MFGQPGQYTVLLEIWDNAGNVKTTDSFTYNYIA
jgi:hypothetical protein